MFRRSPLFGSMLFSIIAISFTGCSLINTTASVKTASHIPRFDAREFFNTVSVSGSSFSHDEKRILISNDSSGVFNVYSQPVAGGDPKQLTSSTTDSIFAVSFFPNDDRLLYRSDQGGNELSHVYVRETDGTAKDLTPGEKVKASFAGWSKDKNNFWILTNERDPKHFDLYRYTSKDYQRERIFTNTEGWNVSDVSQDGRWVALAKVRNNADNNLYVWDSQTPDMKPKLITKHEGNISHGVLGFTPDCRRLYYNTDGHGEFSQAWSYYLGSGDHKPEIKADWDVSYVSFSETGRYRVTGINEDARTRVTVIDTTNGQQVKLPKLPQGDLRGVRFSRSETLMACYINSDTSPSNLHVINVITGSHIQLTNTLNPAIKREYLVDGQVIRYKSFDGEKIPAILYRPHGATRNNKVPALVWVHGGPGGQSRHGYSAIKQHLINHGYAVLAVNNRGSSGYGKTFFHKDDLKHGEDDLQDCVYGRKYLEGLDWVDGSRVGIIGGSYGGYMVAAALTFTPEAFNVGIDIFGVTNWVRTLENIPPWWESFREYLYAELGDPEKDSERLHRISPLFHASNIVKPLMVIQGANDPRVLKVESDELVEAARKNNVPVTYIVFPDEGHGFLKKENRITASNAYVKFLDTHLRK